MLSLLFSWHFSQHLFELPSGIIALHLEWVQYFLGGAAESGFVRGSIWNVERNMRGNQIC